MKSAYLFLLLVITLLPGIIRAQSNPLDKLINKYEGKSGFRYIELETNFHGCLNKDSNSETDVKFISFREDSVSKHSVAEIYSRFIGKAKSKDFKDLIILFIEGAKAELMIRHEGSEITGVIISMAKKDHIMLFGASGSFELNDLKHLKDLENCEEFEWFKKFCEH